MKTKFSLILFFTLYLFQVQAQDNVIDEVVWVVGDEPILRSDVEKQRIQAQYEGVKFSGDPYCVIPEQLAIEKLFLHQADLDSIIVKESDVISQVDRSINQDMNRLGSKEKMEEYFGTTIAKIRETRRILARNQETVRQIQSKIVGNISATPSEVRQYFDKMPTDSIPMAPAESEVEIITIEPQYDNKDIEAIKERLRDFTDRVNKGTSSFSTLAVMYSADRGSAKAGGELGFMGKGELLPEFANVAFSLTDPKKVSKIVETEYGFHIIQLIEKRGDRINCRHILLKPEVTAAEKNKSLLNLDSVADLIRNNKASFQVAANLYSSDKDTKNNGGLMVNPRTGNPRFQMEELPQEVSDLVYKMNVGEVSKPFMMLNSKEKPVAAIVRVKAKTKAHKANINEDFQLLRGMVETSKRSKILENWIVEKQKKTYVWISENSSKCTFQHPGWIKIEK